MNLQSRSRGRPSVPSGKYKDSQGNPINVYAWRKLNRDLWNKQKKETESLLRLNRETLNLFRSNKERHKYESDDAFLLYLLFKVGGRQ